MRPEFYDGDEGCSGGRGSDGMMAFIGFGVGAGVIALIAATLLAAFGML